LYKPVPGKFKDHIAICKANGYQSLHTTVVGPSGINVEFQVRTETMHRVAESGVAAHWLYKDNNSQEATQVERVGAQWLQSLLEIQDETRDASEFWDHVKVDLFPDAVYVFTPRSQILALPRGATVVDFAYAIHSNVGNRAVSATINGEPVPLRTEVRNGDVIEVLTEAHSTPNPGWLSFVRTARARSKIRQHLKSQAHAESERLGEMMLAQAVRAEGIETLPERDGLDAVLWDKLLRFTGNRSVPELLTDIGLGKRVASIVAKRLTMMLADHGHRPDALLLTRERFAQASVGTQNLVVIDGSQNASIRYAHCCRPIPGDAIVGYLGRGEGLTVHAQQCNVVDRLRAKDPDRFIGVEWSEEPVRTFETGVVVTVHNSKGVLAKVAGALANAEADITHVDMTPESSKGVMDLRFVIAVRDNQQLEQALKNLRHTPQVIRAARAQGAGASRPAEPTESAV